MKNIKRGVVLIYVLFLVTLSVILATILLSNNDYLFNITEYFEIEWKLYNNINSDWKIIVDLNRSYNTNGSWFIDNISCPTTWVSMSWNTVAWTIWTNLVFSWSQIYCEWTYSSNFLKLYFNTAIDDIISAEYDSFLVGVTSGIWNTTFWDSDNTLIDFSSSSYSSWDNIDDNFNSDNYMVTSTWNTSTWVYYNWWFQDDDNYGRKIITWFVSPDFWYKKVFWNTFRTSDIIDKNTNNNDSLNIKIWDVTDGVLLFDLDTNSEMKVLKFDKDTYKLTNELILLEWLDWTIDSGIGYLQDNWGVLSLSWSITWDEYIFDFSNNDYAIMLKASSTRVLFYKISWETTSWTGIYITPIDDSWENIVIYKWNELIINSFWNFIWKESEILYKK